MALNSTPTAFFEMLPSDTNYQSKAPEAVKQLLCFQIMLKENSDPYASHSLNPDMCRMLETVAASNQLSAITP